MKLRLCKGSKKHGGITIVIHRAKTFRLKPLIEASRNELFINWLWFRGYGYK